MYNVPRMWDVHRLYQRRQNCSLVCSKYRQWVKLCSKHHSRVPALLGRGKMSGSFSIHVLHSPVADRETKGDPMGTAVRGWCKAEGIALVLGD